MSEDVFNLKFIIMKRVIYAILLMSFVGNFMSSCNKEKNPNSGALESFSKLKSPAEQRLAFNLLTASEREILVSSHIDFCLSFFDLTSSQKFVLNEAKKNVPSFFQKTSREENKELLSLEMQISKHFSMVDSQTKELIFSTMVLSEEDVDNWNKLAVPPPVYSGDCTCSTSSDYCSRNGSGVKCLQGGCGASKWGCGTLWAYACGGMCFAVLAA